MTITRSTHNARLGRPPAPTAMTSTPAASAPLPPPFARPLGLRVQGATDEFGTPYVEFVSQKTRLFVPLADVHSNAARAAIAAHNIILTKAEWDDVRAEVDRLDDFPTRPLGKRPGWATGGYILADGHVIAPASSQPPVPLFEQTSKCKTAGTLNDWKRGVIGCVGKASLPTVAIMIPFASSLLPFVSDGGNFGIEFVGSDRGKLDCLQRLAASVVGRPHGAARDRYTLSGTTSPPDLLSSLEWHADNPLLITDVDLYAVNATNRTRGAKFDELLTSLLNGTAPAKRGAALPQPARFVFMTTSTESLSDILTRLRPIPTDRATEHVFTVPTGGRLKRATVAKVQSLTSAQHATPMVHFLKALVEARGRNEGKLRERIGRWKREFREHVTPGMNDPATEHAIAAFGLVYAAGRLAKAYGALPKSLHCMKAAVACYDGNRATLVGQAPSIDRLKALAANPRTMRVDPRNLPSISDDELDELPAILRANPRGKDELLLTPTALSRAFPKKKLLLRDPSLAGIIKHDGGRGTVKRAIRSDKTSDRVVCFRLP